MRLLGRDVAVPRLVLGVLVVAVSVAIVVGLATTGAAFAPYNQDWQGASELRETAESADADPVVATDSERYESIEANGTVAFVLAPENRSQTERERLATFVERGGLLVVASADPDAGNALLEGLGVDVTVDDAPLRDDVENLHGPAFPTVTDTATDHSAVRNASGLALNYGTALTVGDDARAIANSSSFSYLDRDGNGEPSSGEALTARPVIASQEIGDGEVIAVSDPSVFINAMLDHEPNRRFAENLAENQERALLDRTDDGVPPLRAAVLWLRGQWYGPALLGVVLVGAIVAWERGIVARVRERALGGVMSDGQKGGDDARVD